MATKGQGFGSTLVEIGTSRADAGGQPCYLETGTDSNIRYYQQRGFEIVGQEDFDGHTITGMVRQPAARGDHHGPETADRGWTTPGLSSLACSHLRSVMSRVGPVRPLAHNHCEADWCRSH